MTDPRPTRDRPATDPRPTRDRPATDHHVHDRKCTWGSTGITWKAPSPLASNPRMVRMYAKHNGNDLTVQVGQDVFNPASIAVFNGKDYQRRPGQLKEKRSRRTDTERSSRYGVSRQPRPATAKANKKEWFAAQPTISDEQIEKLFCPAVKQGNRGPELAVTMDRLEDSSRYDLSSYVESTNEFVPYRQPDRSAQPTSKGC